MNEFWSFLDGEYSHFSKIADDIKILNNLHTLLTHVFHISKRKIYVLCLDFVNWEKRREFVKACFSTLK